MKYWYLIESSNGMNTKIWGSKLWDFLFISILGAYPNKIDKYDKHHLKIRKHFKKMIYSMQYTLPCSYCRKSFKLFLKQHSIKPYLNSRLSLVYWLYLLKDLVNKKLINQENEKFLKLSKNITDKKELETLKKQIYYTVQSPPFIDVLLHYEQYRST
jgi:hypothetical protein